MAFNIDKGRNTCHNHGSTSISVVLYAKTLPGSVIQFREQLGSQYIGAVDIHRPGLMVAFPSFLYHCVPSTFNASSRISYAFDFSVNMVEKNFYRNPFPMDLFSINRVVSTETFTQVENATIQDVSVKEFGSRVIGQNLVYTTKFPSLSEPLFEDDFCSEASVETIASLAMATPASWPPHGDQSLLLPKNKSVDLKLCRKIIYGKRKEGSERLKVVFIQRVVQQKIRQMLSKLETFSEDPFIHTYLPKKLVGYSNGSKLFTFDDVEIKKIEQISLRLPKSSRQENRHLVGSQMVLNSVPFTLDQSIVCPSNSKRTSGIVSIAEEFSSSLNQNRKEACGIVFDDSRMKYK